MKYPVVKNKVLRLYMNFYDKVAYCINEFLPKKNNNKNAYIKKILLYNPAALGDVWYTLRLTNSLKTANPDIEIGVLVGSWTADMVRECVDVSYVHILDHPVMVRKNVSFWRKIKQYLMTRRRALQEIKNIDYDLAVDCYYFFPSAAFLFYQAGITNRVGYDSREGVYFYTNFINWQIKDIHNIEYQADLLSLCGIDCGKLESSMVHFREKLNIVESYKIQLNYSYIIVSVGTGDPMREWPVENWLALLEQLKDYEYRIVFVGAGKKEEERIQLLKKRLSYNTISLCNKLTIGQLAYIIRKSRLFIGLESFAGHIAATYKIPQISIMHGFTNQNHWQPYANPNCIVVRKNVACSPCYFPSRCKNGNMCMNISINDVFCAVKQLLEIRND